MDIFDAFNAAVMHDDALYEKSKESGLEAARARYVKDAFEMGCAKGYTLAREVFLYGHLSRHLLSECIKDPIEMPWWPIHERTRQHLEAIVKMSEKWPRENVMDGNVDLDAMLQEIRSRFKVAQSALLLNRAKHVASLDEKNSKMLPANVVERVLRLDTSSESNVIGEIGDSTTARVPIQEISSSEAHKLLF